jgi:flavodoxin
MKALVVYDSVFGNTAKIGEAIASALGSPPEVRILKVSEASPEQLTVVDLLVVGSPTRGFRPTPATMKLLKSMPQGGLKGVRVAAFDTRFTEEAINRVRILALLASIFGYAAKPTLKRLAKKGGQAAAPPEGFYVADTEGPLLDGELERAAAWADSIKLQAASGTAGGKPGLRAGG